MKTFLYSSSLLICLMAQFVYAQEQYVTLSGKIVDATSHEALSYASIRIHRKNMGTLSNDGGGFIFKIPPIFDRDSLEISFVGYKSAIVPIASFLQENYEVRLEPATSVLQEVTVKSQSGLDIIKEVIARIPVNYDTTGKQLQAFYREAINLGKDSISFIETVLDIYKSSYTHENDKDQINLLKGRRAKIRWRPDPLYGWLSGLSNGARGSLGEDLIKNIDAKNNPLNSKNFRYYDFTLTDIMDQGSKSLYVITFSPSKRAPRSRLTIQGKCYVNTVSMALERIDWELSPGGVRWMNNHRGYGYTIMSVAYQTSLFFSGIHEVITYSEFNNKWYLKEVQKEFTAKLSSKKREMKDVTWKAKTLFVVTKILPGEARPFPEKVDIMNSNRNIGSLIGKNFDPKFWENYNVIQPSYVDTVKKTIQSDTSKTKVPIHVSNRQNGFTRADTLRGKLTPLRTCYDVSFYHLDVTVDPATKSIRGSSTIRFRIVEPFTKMQVDLYANMKIEKIIFEGRELSYAREYDAVYVQFPSEQLPGKEEEIRIFYSGKPQVPNRSISMHGGFLWSKDAQGKPWIQVVCQGSGASLWWPNKDHLSDEPDSARITVTVPNGLMEISNGRLRSRTELPDGTTQFDWYVSYPINNYNITLNIGEYEHLTDSYVRRGETLTLDYYCKRSSLEKAKLLFKNVKPMLAVFERDFGPFPFPRDGFTLMESTYPMEHQSAVGIGGIDNSRSDSTEIAEVKDLMWHEASHEWWGNSVSVKDLADFWVHEAFASYAEALMIESIDGYEASSTYMNEQAILNQEPIIGVYDVNHIHYNIGDIYNKGCLMINTLRHVINNDSLWFDILRGIQKQFKYKTVTSSEIEAYISQKTKTDYTYFFDQYLRHTALPKLVLHTTEQGSSLILKYKWQADVRDFRMPIKITTSKNKFEFIYPTPQWQTVTLKDMQSADFEVKENDFLVEVANE